MNDQPRSPSTPVQIPRRYPPAPLVGVAAAVFDHDGRVLLVQRGNPPRQGQWGLPGGLLDLGERLEDGVRREVWEECGIRIQVEEMVATFQPIVHDAQGRVEYHYVVIDFWARHLNGEATPQDDAMAVAWVDQADLAGYQLAADTFRIVTDAYQQWKAAEP